MQRERKFTRPFANRDAVLIFFRTILRRFFGFYEFASFPLVVESRRTDRSPWRRLVCRFELAVSIDDHWP